LYGCAYHRGRAASPPTGDEVTDANATASE